MKPEDAKLLEIGYARWLAKNRPVVQRLLVDLYKYYDAEHKSLLSNPVGSRALNWLAGAAFALWRAAFLTVNNRDLASVLIEARRFLSTVIADNAINFPQDKSHGNWTFGYYLNNADFRVAGALYLMLGVNHESEIAIGKTTHEGTVQDLDANFVLDRFEDKIQPTIKELLRIYSEGKALALGATHDAKGTQHARDLATMLDRRKEGIVGIDEKRSQSDWEISYKAADACFRLLRGFRGEKK